MLMSKRCCMSYRKPAKRNTPEAAIEIRAPGDSRVVKVYDRVGDAIDQGHVIVELQPVLNPAADPYGEDR
jgi:biotin carboxyl carrier protein